MLQKLRYQKTWLTFGWLLVALIVFLSLYPFSPEDTLPVSDKIQHTFAYAVLTAWFLQIYHGQRSMLTVAILVLLLGAALEVTQSQTSARYGDWWDLGANSLGIMAGLLVALTPLRFSLLQIENRFFSRVE